MYRTALEDLKKWKARETRRPLIVRGARQIGKTWLVREFGASEYENVVYVDFEDNERMRSLFSGIPSVERLITGLELHAGHRIDPESTLLIFDEVQEAPETFVALKLFNKEAPQYHIICTSSFMDVVLRAGVPFPAERVEILDLHPLSFPEFLLAMGKDAYVELLRDGRYDVTPSYQQDYTDLLTYYFFVGGMPEAVATFVDSRDFGKTREAQRRILASYEQSFSHSVPAEIAPRVRMLWNSVPGQLAKKNKKFVFGLMKEGARAREFESALLWLADSGLVHDVHRVSEPTVPLEAFEDPRAFKLFLLDVGLLSCLLGLRQDALLDSNTVLRAFEGALIEQYVLQQFESLNRVAVYYWGAERGTAEVPLLIDNGMDAIPIEIVVEQNLQSKKLKVFRDRFQPKQAIRATTADFRREFGLLNLPLWAIGGQ